MNFARGLLCAVVALSFSLTCVPMDAVADILMGNYEFLPGIFVGAIGTEAVACTNEACTQGMDVVGPGGTNFYAGNVGNPPGSTVTESADAEFDSNGVPAPALTFAQAKINNLQMVGSSGNPVGANGSGIMFAAFTDVLTFSSFVGLLDPFFQVSIDPVLSAAGGRSLTAQLFVYWYGPGTPCAAVDAGCSATGTATPAVPDGAGFSVPGLTDADTLAVFMSLTGIVSAGGAISDPASVMISNLPAGVSVISEGGGTYTAGPAAVPEPASWPMVAASVAALFWIGRKRRRSAKRAPTD
jgi:hypothetical protein